MGKNVLWLRYGMGIATFLLISVAHLGCGDEDGIRDSAPDARDSGPDGRDDGSSGADGDVDAPVDSNVDAHSDSGGDADSGSDAAFDADQDAPIAPPPNSYFVDATGGNDDNTGRSHDQAWRTLSKVNNYNGFEEGDDVYLLCGETWDQQRVHVSWSGSDGDPVLIGAYYMYDGSEAVGVNSDGRPIIQGTLDTDGVAPDNNYPNFRDTHLPLVHIHAPYVTIQDLHIKDSGSYSISVWYGADFYTIQRNRMEDAYKHGIYGSSADYGTIRYNYLTGMNSCILVPDLPWGGAIEWRHSSGVVVEYNYVNGGGGEAYGIGNDSIVRFNIAQDVNSVCFYMDGATNSEVAYNLAIGTADATYRYHSPDWNARGFEINIEPAADNSYDCENLRIHHNTAINCGVGLRMIRRNANYQWDYIYAYNNQFIDCQYSISVFGNNGSANYSLGNHVYIKNNISYPYHDDTVGHLYANGTLPTTWDIDYNQWSIRPPPTGMWSGAHDSTADPTYPRSGAWRGTYVDLPDIDPGEMVPTVFATGTDLGDDYDDAIGGGTFDFITIDPIADPITINFTDADMSGWNMGPFATE